MEIDQRLGLKQDTLYDTLVLYAGGLIFATTILMATLQVAIRLLNLPLDWYWTEPVGRFALIVGTYFGAAIASRNNENIKLEFLLDRVGKRYPRVKYAADVFVLLVVVSTLAVVVYHLVLGGISNLDTQIVGLSWATLGMMFLLIAGGLGLMLVNESIKLWHLVSDEVRGTTIWKRLREVRSE
ncbi:TRAP transporter small permease subunit [Natrialba taiwanensis]|uniref:Tripartite ATP-independent periplasmic transporters DctQ component domain-containing protein n=1 Tax=Natrialba taiwanensis DSM 12281 TaxID=1230458 RepID=M0AG60_9EURY|nr:TRAP transporter small permease subunit [Natrialba taiwanensis]ELY96343.1 hypothetical protein C484_01475 [Natrialba taiwanensis DSM 12281]